MWYESIIQFERKFLSDSKKTNNIVWNKVLAMKNQRENKIKSSQQIWGCCYVMFGKTRYNRIRNNNIREKERGVEPIIEKKGKKT